MQKQKTKASKAGGIEAAILQLREETDRRFDQLLESVRGSSDLAEPARQARATSAKSDGRKQVPLVERVLDALVGPDAPMSTEDLASYLETDQKKVAKEVASLVEESKVFNVAPVGIREELWIGVVGDATPTPELNAHVFRLLMLRPFAFSELMQVTGARRGRVSGAIVELQKGHGPKGYELRNVGSATAFRWHLVPTAARRR